MTSCKHKKEQALVKRIQGQIGGIAKMMDEERYCLDIINQIKAARSALNTLETRILATHLHSCVKESFLHEDAEQQAQKIQEILTVFKRFNA